MQTADYRNTFTRLKNLKMLHLCGVNCDFTRAFTNTKLVHLTEFRFTDSPMLMMEAEVVSLPSALPNLECIDFSGSQITNKLLRVLLSGLKKVKSVILLRLQTVDNETAEIISQHVKTLTRLELGGMMNKSQKGFSFEGIEKLCVAH